MGKIKRSRGFKALRIKIFSCAAFQTCSIRDFFVSERAAQAFMPAAEKLAENADLVSNFAAVPFGHRLSD